MGLGIFLPLSVGPTLLILTTVRYSRAVNSVDLRTTSPPHVEDFPYSIIYTIKSQSVIYNVSVNGVDHQPLSSHCCCMRLLLVHVSDLATCAVNITVTSPPRAKKAAGLLSGPYYYFWTPQVFANEKKKQILLKSLNNHHALIFSLSVLSFWSWQNGVVN